MRTKADKQEFRPKRKRGIRVATLVASGAVAAGGMFLSAGAASASPMPESPAVSTVVQQGDHGHSYKHYDKRDHHGKDKRDHHGKDKNDHHGKDKRDHHGKDKRDHHGKDKRDHHGKDKNDHHGKGKNDHHGKDKHDRD